MAKYTVWRNYQVAESGMRQVGMGVVAMGVEKSAIPIMIAHDLHEWASAVAVEHETYLTTTFPWGVHNAVFSHEPPMYMFQPEEESV